MDTTRSHHHQAEDDDLLLLDPAVESALLELVATELKLLCGGKDAVDMFPVDEDGLVVLGGDVVDAVLTAVENPGPPEVTVTPSGDRLVVLGGDEVDTELALMAIPADVVVTLVYDT